MWKTHKHFWRHICQCHLGVIWCTFCKIGKSLKRHLQNHLPDWLHKNGYFQNFEFSSLVNFHRFRQHETIETIWEKMLHTTSLWNHVRFCYHAYTCVHIRMVSTKFTFSWNFDFSVYNKYHPKFQSVSFKASHFWVTGYYEKSPLNDPKWLVNTTRWKVQHVCYAPI